MIVGIDGCPSGWVCALGTIEDNQLVQTEMRFVLHPDEICQQYTVQKMCIDMPIGLPKHSKKGGRGIDIRARKILGKGASSRVFSPPIRSVLYCDDYQEALQKSKETPPDGVSSAGRPFGGGPCGRGAGRALPRCRRPRRRSRKQPGRVPLLSRERPP